MTPDHPLAHAPTTPRYQMLDVWRGVVCLLVVLEHAGVALWQGVDDVKGLEGSIRRFVVGSLTWNAATPLFFVMSGYCIAASLESTRKRGVSPGAFLMRRLWRIYPTYWAALLGFVVLVATADALGLSRLHQNGLSLAIAAPGALDLRQWIGNLTLTETWRPLVTGGYGEVYTRVAWSLCYQEQFYVVCVLALWLAPARLDRVLAAVTVAVLAYRISAWDSGSLHLLEGTFPYYWHVFAVGLIVHWRLSGAGSVAAPGNWWPRRGVELLLAALLAVGLVQNSVFEVASAGFGLLLIATHRWDLRAGSLTVLQPFRACGRRSFSIYLTHLPVTTAGNVLLYDLGLTGYWTRVFVLVPAVTAASVAVGWAFHRAVESRFLGAPPSLWARAAGSRRPSLAGVPVCVGLTLYGAAASAISWARSAR